MNRPLIAALLCLALSAPAAAEPPTQTSTSAPAPPAAAPAPYSLPFMLRAARPANVVRLDTVLALSKNTTTLPLFLFGSYKVLPELAVLARVGLVSNFPKADAGGVVLTNPFVGGQYGIDFSPDLRFSAYLGLTIPLAGGGGNAPDKVSRATILAGMPARSAMDNAVFATNYLTVIPGFDLAYVRDGLTLQAEVTGLFLLRVRGDQLDKDGFRLNLTAGLHAGYFLFDALSVAAEARYQVWLVNDTVYAGADNPAANNLNLALGARLHFKTGEKSWIRPGLSVALGLDQPMSFGGSTGLGYLLLQLDVPYNF